MFKPSWSVDILRTTSRLVVVLGWVLVGTRQFNHSRRIRSWTYPLFKAHTNPKLIPLLFYESKPVDLWLCPLSTGPITTTTYINTNNAIAGGK